MEKDELIARVVQRTGIKLDKDDPAFVLVELNRLSLEEAAQQLRDDLNPIPDRINDALRSALTHVEATTAKKTSDAITRAIQEAQRMPKQSSAEEPSNSKWLPIAACAGGLLVLLSVSAGYWMGQASSTSENNEVQLLTGTDEGRAALALAKQGQARLLLECTGEGWTTKDGYCYGTPKGSRTVGWRIN